MCRQALFSSLLQLHKVGLVHGDFRESNVLLGPSNPSANPYLIDFTHSHAHYGGKCPGPKACFELRDVARQFGLSRGSNSKDNGSGKTSTASSASDLPHLPRAQLLALAKDACDSSEG